MIIRQLQRIPVRAITRILTDNEIADLLNDEKPLPANWESRLRLRQKRRYQYEERQLDVVSDGGHNFRFIARRNRQNQLDFSIILVFEDGDGSEYRLIRYNGKHPSKHTNRWEKDRGEPNHTFEPAFHVHRATERYQTDTLRPQMSTPTTVRRSTPFWMA